MPSGRFPLLLLLSLSLIVASPRSSAQNANDPPPANGSDPAALASAVVTISKRVDEVNLAFTVTDKKGHFISNLGATDFQVLDNRLPPQGLTYFQQQTDLPMRVALLIDASDSIKYRFKFEQDAASVFLKKILRPGKDMALVAAFNSRVRLMHDLSDNFAALGKAVKAVKAGGNTRLYDAITFASQKLRASPPGARRAIILITDGEDTQSRALMYDAEQAAIRAEVTMFALSTNDLAMDPYPKGEAVLDLLTAPTGGQILPARSEWQLKKAFEIVEKTLRNQYALAYQPSDFKPDGSYRRVEVLPRKRGLKVQCRKGYFARREEAQNLTSEWK